MKLFVSFNLLVILTQYRLKSICWQLAESIILIELTDSEIDKMPCYAVEVNVQKVVKEFQPILIYVTSYYLFSEWLSPL